MGSEKWGGCFLYRHDRPCEQVAWAKCPRRHGRRTRVASGQGQLAGRGGDGAAWVCGWCGGEGRRSRCMPGVGGRAGRSGAVADVHGRAHDAGKTTL